MKKTITIALSFLAITLFAQTFTETIKEEFKFEKPGSSNSMILANISGDIIVEGYSGDKILIEVERTIKAKTDERLAKGKAEMQLRKIDRYDTIIFFVGGGCQDFVYNHKRGRNRWGYEWDCPDRNCQLEYDYNFDFTVKVPFNLNIEVSTINNGKIKVMQVKGAVKANNVNGAIALSGLEGPAQAHTVNGDVDLDYTKNPSGACKFYTLNGDINALFQKGLAANMSFKSFNGDLYTNLNDLTSLPTQLEKIESKNGIKLKVGGKSVYKVGQGGALLDFETFNGDAIIKEK